jgi:hypothetical protein
MGLSRVLADRRPGRNGRRREATRPIRITPATPAVDVSAAERVERRDEMGPVTTVNRGRSWPRQVRAAAVGVGVLLTSYALALALLSHPAVERRLRDRIVEAIRARTGGEVAVEGRVRVDPLLRVSFGPLVVRRRGAADGPPLLRVERVRTRAQLGALLDGRIAPASVQLSGARLALGSGLELGPLDADVASEREGRGERVALDLRLAGGGRAGLEARRSADGWRGRAWASRLGPELLPGALREGAAARLSEGSVSIVVEGTAAPELASAEARVQVRAEGIVLEGERIGPAAVGPMELEAEGTARWDAAERLLSFAGGRMSLLGAARVEVDGAVQLVSGHPFSLSLRADGLDFAGAVAALPDALAVPAGVARPEGTLDARASVAGPLLVPAEWIVSAAFDLSRLRAAARRAPPVALRAPFVYRPPDDPAGPPVGVGAENPDFVPIAELPLHVVRAVTTSEDGGFFGHQGFDFEELRNALAGGADAGRIVRGGSTITQQLAKNLYLGRERTFTRKVREAAITVALEATVPKERLLEIYLNVIEWGPGLRGIGPAARHWFGKDARELTPMEAAFLASVVPNPTRYHYMYDRGAVSEAWRRRVDDVLFKMAQHGVLGDEDLARALAEPVVFASG